MRNNVLHCKWSLWAIGGQHTVDVEVLLYIIFYIFYTLHIDYSKFTCVKNIQKIYTNKWVLELLFGFGIRHWHVARRMWLQHSAVVKVWRKSSRRPPDEAPAYLLGTCWVLYGSCVTARRGQRQRWLDQNTRLSRTGQRALSSQRHSDATYTGQELPLGHRQIWRATGWKRLARTYARTACMTIIGGWCPTNTHT